MKRLATTRLITIAALFLLAQGIHAATDEQALATRYNCLSCHSQTQKIVGPSFDAIAAKYAGDPKALATLTGKVQHGSTGVWGSIPMPATAGISEADARALVTWILRGK